MTKEQVENLKVGDIAFDIKRDFEKLEEWVIEKNRKNTDFALRNTKTQRVITCNEYEMRSYHLTKKEAIEARKKEVQREIDLYARFWGNEMSKLDRLEKEIEDE